jgi:hypothetical protein
VQHDAIDYFIATPTALDWATEIPALVIGRIRYDNWIVDYAVHHIDTVDASLTIRAVHQVRGDHNTALDFVDVLEGGQTTRDGNYAGHARKPDKDWNKVFMPSTSNHGSTSFCRFVMVAAATSIDMQVRLVWSLALCQGLTVSVFRVATATVPQARHPSNSNRVCTVEQDASLKWVKPAMGLTRGTRSSRCTYPPADFLLLSAPLALSLSL